MKLIKYALSAFAIVGLGLAFGYALVGDRQDGALTFGAAAGTEHYNHERFLAGLTEGGAIRSTTTNVAAETLTAAQLEKFRIFQYTGSSTVGVAAITVTLPASTTMSSVLPKPGDTRTWIFENNYGAAATTTTIAAGTGIDLQEPDGQNVVIGIGNYAWVECFRKRNTDIACKVNETIPAD